MTLFNGKLDAIDLVAIEEQEKKERQKKLDFIIKTIQLYCNCDLEGTVYLNSLTDALNIEITKEEFEEICKTLKEEGVF